MTVISGQSRNIWVETNNQFYFFLAGQLRNIETDNGFNFEEIAGNRKYNQKRYEAIGDVR